MYKVITCGPKDFQLQQALNENRASQLIQVLPIYYDGKLKEYSIIYLLSERKTVYENEVASQKAYWDKFEQELKAKAATKKVKEQVEQTQEGSECRR